MVSSTILSNARLINALSLAFHKRLHDFQDAVPYLGSSWCKSCAEFFDIVHENKVRILPKDPCIFETSFHYDLKFSFLPFVQFIPQGRFHFLFSRFEISQRDVYSYILDIFGNFPFIDFPFLMSSASSLSS